MNTLRHLRDTRLSIVSITVLVLVFHSCAVLPPEVQAEIEAAYQQQLQQSVESLRRGASDLAEEHTEKLIRQIEETWEGSASRAKEFLGLEAPSEVGYVSIGISTETSRTVIEGAFQEAYIKGL